MEVYSEPGPHNTDAVLNTIKGHVGDKSVVIASVTGNSLLKSAKVIDPQRIVGVTCPCGMYFDVKKMDEGPFNDIPSLRDIRDKWRKEGKEIIPMDFSEETKKSVSELGIRIVKGTIPLFGVSFSMRLHLNHINSLDIVAKTLELFSTGTLVCLEIVMMAVDAGIIEENTEVISLAGTEQGLDTACLIRSCSSANLFHPRNGGRIIQYYSKPKYSYMPDIGISYLRSY